MTVLVGASLISGDSRTSLWTLRTGRLISVCEAKEAIHDVYLPSEIQDRIRVGLRLLGPTVSTFLPACRVFS